MSKHVLLAGAKTLRPLAQGDLSRLCGVYSHINAIQLALYPQELRSDELQDLFLLAVRHLSRARQLSRVLGVGMSADMWTSIGDTMVAHVNTRKGSALRLDRALHGPAARNRELALQQICQSLFDGQPVIAMLDGALGHFTAIAGCTKHRLRLFDSSGFHWIEMRSIAVSSDAPRRHQIHPAGVLKIVDDW